MPDPEKEDLRRELEGYRQREQQAWRDALSELKDSVGDLKDTVGDLVAEMREKDARIDERLKKLEEADKAKTKAAIAAGGGFGGAIVGVVEAFRALF